MYICTYVQYIMCTGMQGAVMPVMYIDSHPCGRSGDSGVLLPLLLSCCCHCAGQGMHVKWNLCHAQQIESQTN